MSKNVTQVDRCTDRVIDTLREYMSDSAQSNESYGRQVYRKLFLAMQDLDIAEYEARQ